MIVGRAGRAIGAIPLQESSAPDVSASGATLRFPEGGSSTTEDFGNVASLPLVRPAPPHAPFQRLPGSIASTVAAGRALQLEGRPRTLFGVVERGLLVAVISSKGGRQAIVEVIGPGGLFGTEALLGHGGAPDTQTRPLPEVRAIVETRVAVVPAQLVGEALRHPAVAGWVCQTLSRQAVELRDRLTRSLTLPLAQRLEGVLHELAARHGRPVPGGTRIGLPVTQELLAAMAGATRESVNRAAHTLVDQGKLMRDGRRYVVPS